MPYLRANLAFCDIKRSTTLQVLLDWGYRGTTMGMMRGWGFRGVAEGGLLIV